MLVQFKVIVFLEKKDSPGLCMRNSCQHTNPNTRKIKYVEASVSKRDQQEHACIYVYLMMHTTPSVVI